MHITAWKIKSLELQDQLSLKILCHLTMGQWSLWQNRILMDTTPIWLPLEVRYGPIWMYCIESELPDRQLLQESHACGYAAMQIRRFSPQISWAGWAAAQSALITLEASVWTFMSIDCPPKLYMYIYIVTVIFLFCFSSFSGSSGIYDVRIMLSRSRASALLLPL